MGGRRWGRPGSISIDLRIEREKGYHLSVGDHAGFESEGLVHVVSLGVLDLHERWFCAELSGIPEY